MSQSSHRVVAGVAGALLSGLAALTLSLPQLHPSHASVTHRCGSDVLTEDAIAARYGVPPERLPPEHPAWALETEYLALGLASVIAVLSPRRIAIGGGVAGAAGLLPRVRARLPALLAGYLRAPALVEGLDQYVVPPTLGATAGVLGGVALAHEVLRDRPP